MAAICGFSIGADMGLFNVALPHMKPGTGMADGRIGNLAAAVPSGVMIGALVVGTLSNTLGRKKTLLATVLLFATGIAMSVGSRSFLPLLTGRGLVGMGTGMYYGVVPVLLTESLTSKARGICLVLFTLAASVGLFAAMAFGAWLDAGVGVQLRSAAGDATGAAAIHDRAWRTLLSLGMLPTAALLPVALLGAESPRWLFGRGKKEQAMAVLLRGRNQAEAELVFDEMTVLADARARQPAGDSPWQRRYLRPLSMGLAIFIFNNAVGTGVLNVYSTVLLGRAGLGEDAAAGASAWMALAAFFGVVGGLLVVSRVGRKALLGCGMAVAIPTAAVAALVMWLSQSDRLHWTSQTTGWVIFGAAALYQCAVAFGPGTCGWLLVSELLPTRIRAHGMGLGVLLGSATNIGLIQLFLPVVNHLGLCAPWLLWGGLTAVYLVFTVFVLPETRGKTLEEIEAMVAEGK